MKITKDNITNIYWCLMDYLEMRRTFTAGMEAMEESHHSLTIDELFDLIGNLEESYEFLNPDQYDGN
jgi:hypothetical protein